MFKLFTYFYEKRQFNFLFSFIMFIYFLLPTNSINAQFNLEGRILENDNPIEGVYVIIHSDNYYMQTVTNENGIYKFHDIHSNVYRIVLTTSLNDEILKNCTPVSYKNFLLNKDTNRVDFNIDNRDKNKVKRISGRVTLDGKPIENIKITAKEKEDFRGEFLNSFKTNSSGYYYTNFITHKNALIEIEKEIDGITYTSIPEKYEINLEDIDNDIFEIDFELLTPSSIEKQTLNPKIYPNPASESLTISGIGQGIVTIYNTLGQKLIEKEIFGTSTINTSTLQTGMYVIKLESGVEVVFEKVIVNK